MSHAAIYRTGFRNINRLGEAESGPIPRAAWVECQPPVKSASGCCPHCLQELSSEHQTTIHRIRWAVVQLFSAIVAIVFCALRLVRLVVAVALSLVGILGFGLQTVGFKIAHPDDRRLLPRMSRG
jgi:hypothetical protein